MNDEDLREIWREEIHLLRRPADTLNGINSLSHNQDGEAMSGFADSLESYLAPATTDGARSDHTG